MNCICFWEVLHYEYLNRSVNKCRQLMAEFCVWRSSANPQPFANPENISCAWLKWYAYSLMGNIKCIFCEVWGWYNAMTGTWSRSDITLAWSTLFGWSTYMQMQSVLLYTNKDIVMQASCCWIHCRKFQQKPIL